MIIGTNTDIETFPIDTFTNNWPFSYYFAQKLFFLNTTGVYSSFYDFPISNAYESEKESD